MYADRFECNHRVPIGYLVQQPSAIGLLLEMLRVHPILRDEQIFAELRNRPIIRKLVPAVVVLGRWRENLHNDLGIGHDVALWRG